MRNRLAAISKTGVTALLFYLLFRNVDLQQFLATLGHARLDIIFAGLLILWVGHSLCLVRWRMLLLPLMPVLSIGRLFKIYCIGLFFNLAFPTAVGGDAVKMYYAGRPSRQYAQSFAATFLDRNLGMLAMMIIACTATIVHPVRLPGIPVSAVVWLCSGAFVFLNILIFTPRLHDGFIGFLRRFHLDGVAAKIDRVSDAFRILGRRRWTLAGTLAISLANQMMVVFTIWVLARGLRITVAFLVFLVFVPVITLVSMIPISLNGMGLREYAFMSLFGAIGVPAASCVALGLMSSALILVSGIPGGVAYVLFKEKIEAGEMAVLEH